MKSSILSLMLILIFQIVFAQTPLETERNKGWEADIDALLSLMKEQHYVYKSRPLPAELLTKAATLKKSVRQFSDERMVFELEKLMYHMRDGHSYVLPFATKRAPSYYLPIQFYVFSDGVYIVDAIEQYVSLIGCEVKLMNGIRVEGILNDMNSYVHQDNAYTVKWLAPTVMRFRGVHEMYGLPALAKDISLSLVDRKRKALVQQIEFVSATSLRGIPKLIPSQLPDAPPPPLYLSNVAKNFWLDKNPELGMLYFQFNQVQDAENESLAEFSVRLDNTLSKWKPRLFVIDVRHNNGGNKGLLRPLIDVIKKYETTNTAATTIVITGRNAFSAAQVFIALIDRETKALFAGEPSGSSPNFVGEEGNPFALPWSGAIGNISNRYHENIPGDKRKWIQPNFTVTLSSEAYFMNRDPVMEYIRKRFGY